MRAEDLRALPEKCFGAPVEGAVWQQFDVGLGRRGAGARAHARALFAGVLPALDAALRQGQIRGWYFMRKPPDIRLRLELLPGAPPLLPDIESRMNELHRVSALTSYAPGRYRAEVQRFGGGQGLDWMHAWSCLDSRLWVELDQVHRGEDSRLLLPQVFHHLFELCAADVTVGWRQLARLIGASAAPRAAVVEPPGQGLPNRLRPLLGLYHDASRRYIEALLALQARGELLRQPVEIAADLALFSFNRHGFSGRQSGPLVARCTDTPATSRS